MVERTRHHLVAGEIFEFTTHDRRTFYGQIRDGLIHLNSRKDFRGRNANLSGAALADFLFDQAKEQGRVDQRFGDARTVQPSSRTKAKSPLFLRKGEP